MIVSHWYCVGYSLMSETYLVPIYVFLQVYSYACNNYLPDALPSVSGASAVPVSLGMLTVLSAPNITFPLRQCPSIVFQALPCGLFPLLVGSLRYCLVVTAMHCSTLHES